MDSDSQLVSVAMVQAGDMVAAGCYKATSLHRRRSMIRRQLLSKLSQLFGVALLGWRSANAQETAHKPLKIMIKSAWGSDDPTRASFPFAHGLALSDAGHEVQIFLTGEATYLMRKATAAAIFPVGWPPLSEMLEKVVAKHIPVFS
jgi:hypothetical protein